MSLPSSAELRDMLVTMLVGAAGGTKSHWRKVVGPVTKRSLMEDVRSNWSVDIGGTGDDRDAAVRAVEIVRSAYPYVA